MIERVYCKYCGGRDKQHYSECNGIKLAVEVVKAINEKALTVFQSFVRSRMK